MANLNAFAIHWGGRPGLFRGGRRWLWQLPTVLMAALVLLPLAVVVFSWSDPQTAIWQHLIETQLGRLLGNTLSLMLGVGIGVMLLGVSLAWLTAMCDFPGRRWLDWALMLPLAIPTYVVAFVTLGLLDFGGPLQTGWRALFGNDAWFPEVRNTGGMILVMTAVLYPYVYLLTRVAFLSQGRGMMDAARALGLGPWAAFFQVALPIIRPAVAAGTALALMEALADFGAVAVFNYDTFTTAIYKAWFGFFNLPAAAQLASLLLLFVLLALTVEQAGRGRARYDSRGRSRERYRLTGWRAALASGYGIAVVSLTFVVPVVQLLLWVIDTRALGLDSRYWQLLGRTFVLGVSAALITVTLALGVAYGQRLLGRLNGTGLWVRLAGLGYALPGSVLAVGVMLGFAFLDRELINPLRQWLGLAPVQVLVGSLAALVLAYVIRFFAVSFGPVQNSLNAIRPSLQEAAQTLGADQWQVLRRVYLPMVMPGLLTALLLVLVDTMKEMPATLLLRPFGWDTLAVRIYELTSEGEWERAALPALTLVLVSLAPVILLIRQSRR